jgi:hypothetical protein
MKFLFVKFFRFCIPAREQTGKQFVKKTKCLTFAFINEKKQDII